MKGIKIVTIVSSLLLLCQVFGTNLSATAMAEEEVYSDQEQPGIVPEEEIDAQPSDLYTVNPTAEEEAPPTDLQPVPMPLGDPMYTPEGLPREQ